VDTNPRSPCGGWRLGLLPRSYGKFRRANCGSHLTHRWRERTSHQLSSEKSRAITPRDFVLCALPFFSASHNGWAAALDILKKLAPATLVNLSNLRSWLFPAAKMPAVVLLARHRRQPEDQITIVQVPWSAAGARSHTFEISPSDIKSVLASELVGPGKLKAAAVGHRRDLLLVKQLSTCIRRAAKARPG
jgi:hypothetical protein